MVTYDFALQKAHKYFEDIGMPVVITEHGRFSEGWFFCYQSRKYMETGDFNHQLLGNSPFTIDKDTGEMKQLSSAYSLSELIKHHENSKKAP